MTAPRSRAENKFKAFFRPRPQHSPASSDAMPSHPHESLDNPPSSYAKSSARSQTRPISSATIATHSTITPLPSDALRNRTNGARHAYAFHPHSNDSHTYLGNLDHCSNAAGYDSDDHHFPRSETPSSRRKLPFHSFFRISLTRRSPSSASTPHQPSDRKGSTSTSASEPTAKSSRKRSFRLTSRPATPKSLDESSPKSPYSIPVPSSPLPLSASPRRRSFGLGSSQRSTPKSSSSNLPLPHPQSPQSGRSHARRHSAGSERPPHDSAVALSEESSHRSVHKLGHAPSDGGARSKGKQREKRLMDSEERPLPDFRPSIDFPSQSLPIDPAPISCNYVSSHSTGHSGFSHLPTVDSASSEENEHSSLPAPHRLPVIPRIIHTPPTPQRPGGEADLLSRLPLVDPSKVEIAKAKAATIAHREQVLVSNSQSHADPQHTASSKGRFTPRIFGGKDGPRTKDSNGQKSSRRPPAGASDGPTYNSPGSNIAGLARNMTSHRSKLGSFDFERPVSALNRSSSTVDRQGARVTRKNPSYSKTRLHSLERTMSGDPAQGGKSIAHHPGPAESPTLSQIKPVHTGDTSVVSFSSVSVQTISTGNGIGTNPPAEQSSSWGRVSGRHILRTSHGTFAFEHPSSLPSSPNPQNFSLPPGRNQNEGHVSGPQPQPTTPLHTIFDARVKHSRGQSYNTSNHVEPGYSNPGERKSKGKGRSLDLGLGLSWAPSRVREEVLMPGLILAREKAKLEKSKANGSDVTKVFETILSEPRFQTFKEYVHRFDAHIIPLEGPSGLLARVEKLLAESGLSERERDKLMSDFTIFVKNHTG